MQMTAKINRLSQDDWHCATLQDIFDKELFVKICNGLSTIKWTEARKSFYIQREENLRLNKYYQKVFSKDICGEIIEKMELFFNEKFEYEFDITAHQMLDGDYIGIHTDSNPYGESNRLTLMLNESWNLEQGGILLALNGNSIKDIRDAWLPIANTGFAFEISEKSYHAVTPIKGNIPRYSIIFTFKKHLDRANKSVWSSFPLASDLKHAISTASFMGIEESIFYSQYITKRFNSLQDFDLYISSYLENAPIGFSYKNGSSINVDQNDIQSKGSDKERIDNISLLKRIPPIIIVKRRDDSFVLVDGSHRLSYAKDNETDICVVIYQENIMEKNQIVNFSTNITKNIEPLWKSISKEVAEVSDEKGAFIYAAYNGEQPLYVGETEVSLQDRFKRNGNSAHCNKPWYKNVTEVRYIRWDIDEMPTKERKLLEQAISIILQPIHYGKVGRPKKPNS